MKKSKWFSSETDKMLSCPCCGACDMDASLMNLLDQIRNSLGRPVIINSGYRCQKYNDSLPGSVKNSAHISGKAVDIKCVGSIRRCELLNDIVPREIIHRVGVAKTFIHIDVDDSKLQDVIWMY